MTFPSEFYYKQKRAELSFTHKPQGVLDLSRAVKGLAPWRKIGAASSLKKKTLVLADWTADQWSLLQVQKAQAVIQQLIEDDFSVFIWQSGLLEPLTIDTLSCLSDITVRHKMTPILRETLVELAVKEQHLVPAADEVHILDDYWLHILVEGIEASSVRRYLKMSAYLYSTHDKDDLLTVIKNTVPAYEGILVDEFNPSSSYLKNKLIEERGALPLIHSYTTINLDDTLTQYFIENNTAAEGDSPALELSDLTSCQKMVLSEIRSGDHIAAILTLTPNLVDLDIRSSAINPLETPLKLTQLTSLHLNKTPISMGQLLFLIPSPSTLIELKVESCGEVSGECILPTAFSSLNYLNLMGTSTDTARNLLQNAPNLHEINLHVSGDVSALFNPSYQGEKLKKASLKADSIKEQSLENFFRSSPNLESLTLSFIKELSEKVQFHLSNLKKLELHGITMSLSFLEHLLMQMPMLDELHLESCSVSGSLFTNHSWMRLKKLTILGSVIKTSELERILSFLPNIEYLKLRLDLEEPFTQPISLPRLKTFDGSHSQMSKNQLMVLLQNPTIEDINLDFWGRYTDTDTDNESGNLSNLHQFSNNELVTESLYLPNLKRFSGDYSCIRIKTLQALFQHASTITTISLVNCTNLHDSDLVPLDLPELKELAADSSNLSLANLQILLANARKLRSLSLKMCDLDDELTVFLQLPELTYLNLEESIFNIRNFEFLVAGALNLKELILQDCRSLDGNFTVQLNFPRLQRLDLTYADVDTEHVFAFLHAAPELQRLDLDGHFELLENDELKELLQLRGLLPDLTDTQPSYHNPYPNYYIGSANKGFQKNKFLDADTEFHPNKKFHVTRVFKPLGSLKDTADPEVTRYRIGVYNSIHCNDEPCTIRNCFILSQNGDLALTPTQSALLEPPISGKLSPLT